MAAMPAASGPRLRVILVCAALLVLTGTRPSPRASASARPQLPSIMLWAWERPSDFRAAPQDVGIAFLAQTVTIGSREPGNGTRAKIVSRRWPLKVAPSAVLSAVTRIEMPSAQEASPGDESRIVEAIAVTADYPQVAAVQIDFDATIRQRDFYRRVIAGVRRRLDAAVPLSMTALASWCVGDRWLDGLPVDEAVPMLFQLGPLNEPYRDVARDRASAHPLCRTSLGTSLDEPIPVAQDGRRVYVFNRDAWTDDRIRQARAYARGKEARR
jgi:hypothetical protein